MLSLKAAFSSFPDMTAETVNCLQRNFNLDLE
jgi:hypothetical protein